jgi:hypothetical protein
MQRASDLDLNTYSWERWVPKLWVWNFTLSLQGFHRHH